MLAYSITCFVEESITFPEIAPPGKLRPDCWGKKNAAHIVKNKNI